MKQALIILAVVAAVTGGVVFFKGEGAKPASSKQAAFGLVQQDISSGSKLIDVRTANEYAAGHIESAENLSLQSIQAGVMPKADKSKKLYVYCQSGNRSAQAAALLERAGYVVEDLGDIGEVAAMGGKVIK